MNKKVIALGAAAVLMLTLAACKSEEPAVNAETVPETAAETVPETTAAVIVAQPEAEAIPCTPRMQAFRRVLEQYAFEHVLPDGTDTGYDINFGPMENNEFAICDVDGDGEEELILTQATAPVAGMCQWVYGYDEETDSIYEKLIIFPNTDYYTGGLVLGGWSHNQGMGGELIWPYTLMGYNPSSQVYEVICHVDSWDRSRGVDWEGNAYPEDKDPDGVGTVFLVTQNEETTILSKAEYDAWRAELFGSSELIELNVLKMTEDNIRAVCPE